MTPSGMFHDDPFDHVRDVLAGVDGILEDRIDVLPLDDMDRVASVSEERCNRAARDTVALVLEPVDLDPVRRYALESLELFECPDELLALLDDDRGL